MSDSAAVAESIGAEGTQAEPTWNYADDIPGAGDAPEWFKGDKYKTVADQAMAYPELEKRFGSFTGAPEEYEVNLRDEITEKGIEINPEDPLLEKAMEFARESNMSQDGFNELVNLYAMSKMADAGANDDFLASQLEALGPNGQSRLDNLSAWGSRNLPADLYEGFQKMAVDADAVQALERMVAMTRSAPLAPDDAQAGNMNVDRSEWEQMRFGEKDANGNLKYATDKAFRAKVDKMRDQLFGTEPARQVIGG